MDDTHATLQAIPQLQGYADSVRFGRFFIPAHQVHIDGGELVQNGRALSRS